MEQREAQRRGAAVAGAVMAAMGVDGGRKGRGRTCRGFSFSFLLCLWGFLRLLC